MAGGLSGLGAMGGGYLEGESQGLQNDTRRVALQDAQTDMMGLVGFGRALQLLSQPPGATAAGPPTAGAGQPSMAGGPQIPRPPGMIPQVNQAGGMPRAPMGGGPQPQPQLPPPQAVQPGGAGPSDMPPGMIPQREGDLPTPQIQQRFREIAPAEQRNREQLNTLPPGSKRQDRMSTDGQGGGGVGRNRGDDELTRRPLPGQSSRETGNDSQAFDLRSVVSAVVRANPGMPPAGIAKAVSRFIPMMNAQSQQQWREMQLALREQANLERERSNRVREGQGERREGRLEEGQEARIAQRGRSLDIQQGNQDLRRGLGERAAELRERAETRRGQEGQQRATSRERRDTLAEQREQRQAAQGDARLKLLERRLSQQDAKMVYEKQANDLKLKKLQADVDAALKRGDQQKAKQLLQAMRDRAATVINEWALKGNTDNKKLQGILDDNRKLYDEMIKQLTAPKGEGTTEAPARAPTQQNYRINPDTGELEGASPGGQ